MILDCYRARIAKRVSKDIKVPSCDLMVNTLLRCKYLTTNFKISLAQNYYCRISFECLWLLTWRNVYITFSNFFGVTYCIWPLTYCISLLVDGVGSVVHCFDGLVAFLETGNRTCMGKTLHTCCPGFPIIFFLQTLHL